MGRFSYHEKKEPVKVEIPQEGFCIPRLNAEMDTQLMAILTPQEYADAIQKCNSTLFWHYPNMAFWAFWGLASCIALLVVGTQVFSLQEDEHFECAEPNGACDVQASIVSDCCQYLCCPRYMSNVTHSHIHSHTFDSPAHEHELDVSACEVIAATRDTECGCETATVTTKQVDTQGNEWEKQEETMTCSKSVKIEGETEVVPEKNSWGVAVGIVCFVASLLSWCVSFMIVFIRLRIVRRFMNANMRDWVNKGLDVRYMPGEHNYKPRVVVTFPPERANEREQASNRETVRASVTASKMSKQPLGVPPPDICGSEQSIQSSPS